MAKLQIFKPVSGATSMEGVGVSLSAADLQGIASRYDASVHEAPLTIGHPTHDAPAYGWVKSLSFADGALLADNEESAELCDLRAKGHYKKVSASFYTPTAPGNPTPGQWALRHVGFLGAQPPGIKGLNGKAVSFAEGEEGVVTFGELPGYAGSAIASLLRGLRDFFIADKGLEVADRVLPDWQIESLREMSQRAADEPGEALNAGALGIPASFSDPLKPISTAPKDTLPMKTAEQLQTELTAAENENKALKAAEATRQVETLAASHASFADALIAEARWPAAAKDVLVATLNHLGRPADVVSFGEGDAAVPLHIALQTSLKAMPPTVSFAEHARDGNGDGTDSPAVVASKAVTYQEEQAAKGNKVNTAEAVGHVTRKAG